MSKLNPGKSVIHLMESNVAGNKQGEMVPVNIIIDMLLSVMSLYQDYRYLRQYFFVCCLSSSGRLEDEGRVSFIETDSLAYFRRSVSMIYFN